MHQPLRVTILLAGLAGVTALATPTTAGTTSPSFTAPSRADDRSLSATNSKYVNEPATLVGADGTRYVAYQRGSQLSTTTDGGRTWRYLPKNVLTRNVQGCASARDVGDVDLTKDNAGRVYFGDLQVTAGATADTGIQPVVAHSGNAFRSYTGTCAAHQPVSVDREWLAAYTAPGKTADQSDVYMSYHDFGPNYISVNASHDGGRTWTLPVPVLDNPESDAASGCDTVPAGTAVDPRTGWVYVAWTSGPHPVFNAGTGCNYTQGTVFNKFWVAVSKDKGKTFHTSMAVQTPDQTDLTKPSDMSEIFGSIAVDRQGGVYIAYTAYNQRHREYDVFVTYSRPADNTGALHFRDNGTGTAAVNQVSHLPAETAYFPRLVAGDRGRVDVIYLGTLVKNVPATVANKANAQYDGHDPDQPNCRPEITDPGEKGFRFIGKPCELPASAPWYLYLAQSMNANTATPSFTQKRVRSDPVHLGDICTLGIFCLEGDNRDLGDVNDIKLDRTGGAQIAYTYETPTGSRTEIDFQCQRGGPGLYAGVTVRDCRG
jgi:hypothetical protein